MHLTSTANTQNSLLWFRSPDGIEGLVYLDGTGTSINFRKYASDNAQAASHIALTESGIIQFQTGGVATTGGMAVALTLDASQDATFAGSIIGSAGNHIDSGLFAFKTSDESVTSSTTLQDDDDLTVTLAANTTYRIEMLVIVVTASGTPGLKMAMNEPDGTYGISGTYSEGISGTTLSMATGLTEITGIGSSYPVYISLDGVAQTGGTGGAFTFQWAQNTSNATAVYVKAGSWIKATKLG